MADLGVIGWKYGSEGGTSLPKRLNAEDTDGEYSSGMEER